MVQSTPQGQLSPCKATRSSIMPPTTTAIELLIAGDHNIPLRMGVYFQEHPPRLSMDILKRWMESDSLPIHGRTRCRSYSRSPQASLSPFLPGFTLAVVVDMQSTFAMIRPSLRRKVARAIFSSIMKSTEPVRDRRSTMIETSNEETSPPSESISNNTL